ncbi:Formin-like protein 18 [Frankliniella fusca]|uniref:Formin-like protein 18 n=1 Tax=Frankliniella fusca TaxID=407009 RepID=A0AAE1GWS2_9NEOP|nr:Formin-like protein 18 [Frankliniella fusca]
MNAAGNHKLSHVMSSSEKCATSNYNLCGNKGHAVEASSVKTFRKAQFVWQVKGNYHLKNAKTPSESRGSSACSQSVDSTIIVPENMSCNSNSSLLEPMTGVEHSAPLCNQLSSAAQSGSDLAHESTLSSSQPPQAGPLCDHHPSPAQTGTLSVSESQYPPLPPLRIGATTVSCVVCDTFNENIRSTTLLHDGDRPNTLHLPTSHPDWNVRKWQTRQIAKAFMDNTINGVIEEMGFNPTPESAPDSDLDDVLSSINFPRVADDSEEEEEEDESVENEGILSAIQSHGLQRHTLQSIPNVSSHYRLRISSPTECSSSSLNTWKLNQHLGNTADVDGTDCFGDNTSDDDDEAGCSQDSRVSSSCKCSQICVPKVNCTSKTSISAASIPDTLVAQECSDSSRSNEINTNTNTTLQQEFVRLIGNEEESRKKRQGKERFNSTFSKRRCVDSADEDSTSSFISSQSTLSPDLEEGVISIASQSSDRNSPTFGHFEFMDAAVAAAIQKKGLSALACQEL